MGVCKINMFYRLIFDRIKRDLDRKNRIDKIRSYEKIAILESMKSSRSELLPIDSIDLPSDSIYLPSDTVETE